MQHDTFDPALWLTRWKEAGGAWTTTIIFRPRRHADDITLDRLCGELDAEKRRALFEHLGETAL
jgi:hypothetical protein